MADSTRVTILKALLILSVVFSLCPLLPATPASAATIQVPETYGTIQAAVNAAGSGDIISVRSGFVTVENITVDK